MLVMLATLLCILVGIALAIFAVVAVAVGVSYLMWPVVVMAVILLWIGYSKGLKRGRKNQAQIEEEQK